MADLKFLRLWDVYSPLLTPTQREMTDMYFNLDLTVSEIAEQKGISRQGVSECLASAKKQLEEYENKLKFSHILRVGDISRSLLITGVNKGAENFLRAHPELSAEAEELKKLLLSDYSAEAESLVSQIEDKE